jgi:alanyl-tRNA synthetase
MKTKRLHYDDPLLLRFDAEVIAHAEHRGRPTAILDRTAFYPESGGQMADRGTLAGVRVADVQLDEEGRVHHLLEGALPPVGARVEGVIDERRRREHMALHTGQHALSRAILDELGAVTLSSRLGESACTIDVDRDGLSLADLRRAEARVCALIDEDRPVRQYFPTREQLASLQLRKPPPETDRVRVVVIEGFDVTPCGGTHVTHTAQIELVRVESVERYKGGTRVTFTAGPRARRSLAAQSDALRAIASELECAPLEVAGAVGRLRTKLDDARAEASALRAQLAALWADRLESDGARVIVAVVENVDTALLKTIAARLAVDDRVVALAAPSAEATDIIVTRGPHSGVSAAEVVKHVARAAGGRGGGRPEVAQGRLPAGIDWVALVREALRT